jgi:hypothetical protein
MQRVVKDDAGGRPGDRRGRQAADGPNIQQVPQSPTRDERRAGVPVAWQLATGTWRGSDEPATLVVFEEARNPGYPADYIEYPNLFWFQPTFPKAGTWHRLTPGEPLVLRYRLLIHAGTAKSDEAYTREWTALQQSRD